MNILLLNPISQEAEEFLRSNHTLEIQFRKGMESTYDRNKIDVVITRSGPILDKLFLQSMPHLRAVIRAGVGIDNIDVQYLETKAIPLYRISSHHANAVAELALGLFLDLARSITYYHNSMFQGSWAKGSRVGMEISGKVLGIVGLGQVGMRLSELARGCGMQVIGVTRHYSHKLYESMRHTGIELVTSLDELPSKVDLLAVTLPLTNETRLSIGTAFISQMRKDAILVNVGRAETIDHNALYEALLKKHIFGAALDVHINEGLQSKFAHLDNVILTPHIGSSTKEAQLQIGKEVVKFIKIIEDELKT